MIHRFMEAGQVGIVVSVDATIEHEAKYGNTMVIVDLGGQHYVKLFLEADEPTLDTLNNYEFNRTLVHAIRQDLRTIALHPLTYEVW